MSAFQDGQSIEKLGEDDLAEVFAFLDPNFRKIIDKQEQLLGDFLIRDQYWELKVEKGHTGNLFLETWSNYKHRKGWFLTCEAPWLIYHFRDKQRTYIINFNALRQWATPERLAKYPEKPQSKYVQKNDTRGRLVPVNDIIMALGDVIVLVNGEVVEA